MRKPWLTRVVTFGLIFGAAFATAAAGDDFRPLFDGKTLDGWVQHGGKAKYEIDNGKIVADGPVDELVAHATGAAQIAVEAEGTGVLDGLGTLGGVRSVSPAPSSEEGRVAAIVTTDGSADVRPAIFSAAKERGWILYELHRETRSLEELFLQLTGGEAAQPLPGADSTEDQQ